MSKTIDEHLKAMLGLKAWILTLPDVVECDIEKAGEEELRTVESISHCASSVAAMG